MSSHRYRNCTRQNERPRRGAMPESRRQGRCHRRRGRYRSTVRVMFDGFKWPTSLHSTYVEAVVADGPSTPVRARR